MFVICVEAIMYLLLYNLHEGTFNDVKTYSFSLQFHSTFKGFITFSAVTQKIVKEKFTRIFNILESPILPNMNTDNHCDQKENIGYLTELRNK